MSADNFYIIRKHPGGGFAAVMGFASDDKNPEAAWEHASYPTPLDALLSVIDEPAEYGCSIHPECRVYDEFDD